MNIYSSKSYQNALSCEIILPSLKEEKMEALREYSVCQVVLIYEMIINTGPVEFPDGEVQWKN